MTAPSATVSCPDCDLTETFEKLQPARERIEAHREETGHDPVWELEDLSPGVVRAGDAAGVIASEASEDSIGERCESIGVCGRREG